MKTVNITVKLDIDDTIETLDEIISNFDYNFTYQTNGIESIIDSEITNVVIYE
jgi:hypothetical protein